MLEIVEHLHNVEASGLEPAGVGPEEFGQIVHELLPPALSPGEVKRSLRWSTCSRSAGEQFESSCFAHVSDGWAHLRCSRVFELRGPSDTQNRIHIDFQSRKKDLDRTSARLTVTPRIARWLGLALLRASWQDEREQRLEVRADSFLHEQVA